MHCNVLLSVICFLRTVLTQFPYCFSLSKFSIIKITFTRITKPFLCIATYFIHNLSNLLEQRRK